MDQVKTLDINDIAHYLGMPVSQLKEQLALLGFNELMSEAHKRAFSDVFGLGVINPAKPPVPRLEHLVEAARGLGLEAKLESARGRKPTDRKRGYVYLLHAPNTGLCKIGNTKLADGSRQRTIISGHGEALINVLTVKVEDRFAVEAAAHQHFAESRSNGEWFNIPLRAAVDYFRDVVSWEEMDCDNSVLVAMDVLA